MDILFPFLIRLAAVAALLGAVWALLASLPRLGLRPLPRGAWASPGPPPQRKKRAPARHPVLRAALCVFAALALVAGASAVLYPRVGAYVGEKRRALAVALYDGSASALSAADAESLLEAARSYNARLAAAGMSAGDAFGAASEDTGRTGEYWRLLALDDTGVMGTLSIASLDLCLPIYHGTGEDALSAGVGHIPGSSLPVGGADTHAVLTAHTGLASAELFTALDRMKTGDLFSVCVAGQTLTYRVDQILTVLPDELESLSIQPGGDYVTLVTCTPYGVNSHRLLVRGARAGDAVTAPQSSPQEESPAAWPVSFGDRAAVLFVDTVRKALGLLGIAA